MSEIKPIFMLWFQGWQQAPKIVKQCALSWQRHNPDWQVVRLDSQTLQGWSRWKRHIPNIESKTLTKQAASDLIRLDLLSQYGGIWADATCYCTQPLDDWLALGSEDPFFAFRCHKNPDKISSWFLAADPESQILQHWHRSAIDYWQTKSKADNYYWVHNLFHKIVRESPLQQYWQSVPSLTNEAPHFFHRHGFSGPVDELTRETIANPPPLLKLTWKRRDVQDRPRITALLADATQDSPPL